MTSKKATTSRRRHSPDRHSHDVEGMTARHDVSRGGSNDHATIVKFYEHLLAKDAVFIEVGRLEAGRRKIYRLVSADRPDQGEIDYGAIKLLMQNTNGAEAGRDRIARLSALHEENLNRDGGAARRTDLVEASSRINRGIHQIQVAMAVGLVALLSA